MGQILPDFWGNEIDILRETTTDFPQETLPLTLKLRARDGMKPQREVLTSGRVEVDRRQAERGMVLASGSSGNQQQGGPLSWMARAVQRNNKRVKQHLVLHVSDNCPLVLFVDGPALQHQSESIWPNPRWWN